MSQLALMLGIHESFKKTSSMMILLSIKVDHFCTRRTLSLHVARLSKRGDERGRRAKSKRLSSKSSSISAVCASGPHEMSDGRRQYSRFSTRAQREPFDDKSQQVVVDFQPRCSAQRATNSGS